MTQRPKMGGRYRRAPMMVDRLQCLTSGSWHYTAATTYPASVHRNKFGVATGRNFLLRLGAPSGENSPGWAKPKTLTGTMRIGAKGDAEIDYFVPTDIGPGLW
jgi:hypothetical protein